MRFSLLKTNQFFTHQFLFRLGKLLKKAKEDGWVNITDHQLSLKQEFAYVTQLKVPRLRGELTPAFIFHSIFHQKLISHIAKSTTSFSQKLAITQGKTFFQYTDKDVMKFIFLIVEICARQVTSMQAWVRNQNGVRHSNGLNQERYETLRKRLSFDNHTLFDYFNKGLRSIVDVGGFGTVDEMIWQWHGNHPFVTFMECKPHNTGIKVFFLVHFLTRSNRPAVTHVIPDIHTPVWTGTEVMNNAVALWPSHGDDGIITDAWFGDLNWLKKNYNLFFTSAVNYGKYPSLFDVLSFGLKYHENRVFTNGDVIVSLFEDNDLMITASTMFSAASPINLDREGRY